MHPEARRLRAVMPEAGLANDMSACKAIAQGGADVHVIDIAGIDAERIHGSLDTAAPILHCVAEVHLFESTVWGFICLEVEIAEDDDVVGLPRQLHYLLLQNSGLPCAHFPVSRNQTARHKSTGSRPLSVVVPLRRSC